MRMPQPLNGKLSFDPADFSNQESLLKNLFPYFSNDHLKFHPTGNAMRQIT
jgi:hypothetical protein